jgi:hypothetical protein
MSATSLPDCVGPFHFDQQNNEVTLMPGSYVFSEPVTFKLSNRSQICGVTYKLEFTPPPEKNIASGNHINYKFTEFWMASRCRE